MNTRPIALLACLTPLLFSCGKTETSAEDEAKPLLREQASAEMPILALKAGDTWRYKVRVEVPPGVTSPDAAAAEIEQEKVRVYRGKVFVAEGLPKTDAFDVSIPGQPVERELVEIYDDKILMRGTTHPEDPASQTRWLDPAVPFVAAGLRPGETLASLGAEDGASRRGLTVVARESVKVPAGEYAAIRLLMTGNDGAFEVRRTTWFVPKVGIVKEEKTRYAAEKLIFRETTELIETSIGSKP